MQKEILPLTSLRFVAAFYVFLFHIQIYFIQIQKGGFGRFLTEGACGMSMFFILSGFVLGYRFHTGVTNYKSYAFSRFSRIYPAYFLAALVTLPWLIASLSQYDSDLISRYLFVIFVNILMIQAWIPQLFTYWNDGGSWSLCVEMFFYALFPFLINRCKNLSNKQLYVALLILYVTASVPGISWVLFNKNINHIIFYSIPIFRISEFIIGIICGLLFTRGIRVAHPNLCAILCVTQLYRYLAYGPDFGFTAIAHNFATVPLLALLMISLASVSSGWLYNIMTGRAFVYLGRISYSFYSFQALVLMTFITKHDVLITKYPMLANNYILSTLALIVLLAISIVSHHFVENKFRAYLNKKFYAKEKYKPIMHNQVENLG